MSYHVIYEKQYYLESLILKMSILQRWTRAAHAPTDIVTDSVLIVALDNAIAHCFNS